MEDAAPKNRYPPKPFIPQKGKDKKPFQKGGSGNNRLDEETRNELQRKKLCFSCKEPWQLGHQCMGKEKVHYIEVVSNSDEEDEMVQEHDEGQPQV